MTRSNAPLLYLEAPAFSARRATRMKIHWIDYAFFTLALIFICGGALFMLEMASAQSSGQSSIIASVLDCLSGWLPVVMHKAATYGMLLMASIVNSALLTLFVQTLRILDRRFSRSYQRRWPSVSRVVKSPRATTSVAKSARRQPATALNTHGFLLSPLLR